MSNENDNVELGSVFEFTDDISKAEAPPPLPPRSYIATVTGAVPKLNKNGGKYGDITFTVSPDQFPPDFAAIQNDAVNLHYRFVPLDDTPAARWRLRKFCEAIRVTASRRFDLNDCVGKSASIKVENKDFQGENRAEIKDVEAL